MFLKSIRLDAFGKLQGTYEFSRDKCNVVCQDNESGKSTLVDAILYSFYGFPSGAGKRTPLRAKDKYRPWLNTSDSSFRTEMELLDVGGRHFVLRCDFSRQQPFELIDAETARAVPLEGISFGRRFFRMPLQSFTECFFLRQDEREGGNHDDLIQVIEEAAVSNQRTQDSSIRSALNALSDCRVHLEEFSSSPLTLDNLIKQIDKRLATIRVSLAELLEQRDCYARQMAEAEQMESQLQQLRDKQSVLEYACFTVETRDIRTLLARQDSQSSLLRQRQERLAQLEAYAQFDPALRPKVQEFYSEWLAVRSQCRQSQRQFGEQVLAPLRAAEEELIRRCELAAELPAIDLQRLASLRSLLAEQTQQLALQQEKRDALRAELGQEGIPLEDYELLRKRVVHLPASDCRTFADYEEQRAELEVSIAQANQRQSEAGGQVAEAKARRDRLRMLHGLLLGAAVVLLALGLSSFLARGLWAGAVWAGAIGLVAAAACGSLCLLYLHRLLLHGSTQLEPALAEEVSASSEARRLSGRLEELEADFQQTLQRRNLRAEDVKTLVGMGDCAQLLASYQAAQEYTEALHAALDSSRQEVMALLAPLEPSLSCQGISEEMIDSWTERLEHYYQIRNKRDQLQTEKDRLYADLGAQQSRQEELQAALDELIRPAVPEGESLEQRVAGFLDGCEHALKLRALLEDDPYGSDLVSPARCSELRQRLEVLQERLQHLHEAALLAETEGLLELSHSVLVERLEQVQVEREELRVRRINKFSECDRLVQIWRQEGPKLQAEIDRLEALRQQMSDFREAVQIAHGELSSIADQVFTQWAAAINSRVNQILPRLNPRYHDVGVSDDLDLSVYSKELGRRLGGSELLQLSKGARDQIAMSLRVAVSEYLSAHVGALPLVLDEPFAHWDDHRFVDGMRFLAELAERHQIILLSCHQWRYRQLGQSHPDMDSKLNFSSPQALARGQGVA